jgi:hypothetical protein
MRYFFVIATLLLAVTSAKAEENKTVHCAIGQSQFWTTGDVCAAMGEVVIDLSKKISAEPWSGLVSDCASKIKKKLPGKDEPTYLNTCEELLDSYFSGWCLEPPYQRTAFVVGCHHFRR